MAEKIVAITESAKEENMKHYNIKDDGKYIVINNSIKFDRMLKQNNNIPHNITNFLIVSRFGNEKLTSIRNAIKIFKEYNRKHKESKLTLVGGGEYENEVKKELEDIKEYTNFLGARNNVLDIMLDNDIVIGLDRCILEAIATKRIAVISGYENITEIVTKDNIEVASGENFSGRGLKEKTVNEIVQELEQLRSKQIEEIVSTNFEYIYKNFNCEKNIYVLREAKKVNTDSKIWYSNIVKLINEIVISKETNDKIWKAKLYLEEQNENKDKVIKKELPELLNEKSILINEVNELKKRNDDLAEVIANFESGKLYKISKKILNLKKGFKCKKLQDKTEKGIKMQEVEKSDYKIIVDNVYKTFNVYLDKANTIKEKLLFFKSRNRKEKREVLQGINLKIKKGEVVALIGTNGSGKSTLLKLMTKIIYPNKGKITTNGK